MDVEYLKHQFEDAHDGVIVKTRFRIGVRHIQMIYMFACAAVMGCIRGSIGIAVLAITDKTRQNDTYIKIHSNWDMRIQGMILSSYFFGYALALVPAELILRRMDAKSVSTVILASNGALCAALPTIINRGGWIATANALFMMGMTQACLVPVIHIQLSKWLVPSEKQPYSTIIYGGIYLGMTTSLPLSGTLSTANLGWELILYTMSMLGISMAILYCLLTASTPAKHHAIGDAEKQFIETALQFYRKRKVPIPWRIILRTKQFWAIASAHSASSALFIFYLVNVPAFLKTVNVSLKEASMYTLLSFVTMVFMYTTTSPTLEWISRLGYVTYLASVTHFRKVINGIGAACIAMGLTILPNLLPDWGNLAVVVLIVTLGFAGIQFSGFLKTIEDMSENFRGTLFLMSCGVSSVAGALVPITVGLILGNNETDLLRWKIVFLFMASVCVIGNTVYTVCGSSERQPWDEIRKRKSRYEYYNVSNSLHLEEHE